MEAGRGEVLVNMFFYRACRKIMFLFIQSHGLQKRTLFCSLTLKKPASRYELSIFSPPAVADPLTYSRRSWRFLL